MAGDPHDEAYRAGQEGRQLSGRALRLAESDPSILDTWREGKADRPDDQPETARGHKSSSPRRPSGRGKPRSARRAHPGGSSTSSVAAGGDETQREGERLAQGQPQGGLLAFSGRRQRSERSGARRAGARELASGATAVPGQTAKVLRGRLPATPAGIVVGMFGAAVVVNYLGGGWPQVRGWLAAKFLNKPYQGTVTASSGNVVQLASVRKAKAAQTAQTVPAAQTVLPPGGVVS